MAKPPPPEQKSEGPPRWTYAVGTLVTAVALGWTIVSYFLPKTDAPKPSAAAASAASSPAPGVNVSGSGNVGVGTMSGGQISIGAPPVAAPASRAGSAP